MLVLTRTEEATVLKQQSTGLRDVSLQRTYGIFRKAFHSSGIGNLYIG